MKMRTEQRFSIRKHAIGVASVLLGTALFTTGAVSADTTSEFVNNPIERDGLIAQTPEVVKDFRVVVIVNGQTIANDPFQLTQTEFDGLLPTLTRFEDADETLERISATNEGNVYTFEYATKQAGDYTVEIFIDGKPYRPGTGYPATLTAETLSEIVAGYKLGLDADVTLNFENVATFGKTYRLNYSTKPVAPKVEETIDLLEIYVDGSKTLDQVIESKEQLERRTKELLDANASRYDGGFEDKGNVRVFTYVTKPVVEETKDFTLITIYDDGIPSIIEYPGHTRSKLLETLSGVIAVEKANGYVADIHEDGNKVTLSFKKAPVVETPKVEEPKEDFTIIVKLDGKVTQESKFEGITHSEFVNHRAAFLEANADWKLVGANSVGNTETLNFSTPPVETDATGEELAGLGLDATDTQEGEAFTLKVEVDGEVFRTETTVDTIQGFMDDATKVLVEYTEGQYAGYKYEPVNGGLEWTSSNELVVKLTKVLEEKKEAKGESTTEEPKPEFVSEKTEDPTVDALSALRNELLAAIDASKLSDAQKSDLAVKVAAAETEKELQAVKAEFDKLVAGPKADPTVDALSALRNELLAAIDASKLSDAQKSDLAVKVAFAETEKELQAIKAEFDKLVAGLKAETKKEAPKADAKADAKKLPETGAKETVALVGMGMVLVLASIGLASVKRRF